MSKIGRKPIDIQGAEVSISGQEISYKGKGGSGAFTLPKELTASLADKKLVITSREKEINRETKTLWGMSRAILSNEISGLNAPFEKVVQINGLGFKAALAGKKLDLTLGYSHKISCDIPDNVKVEIDKTGQILTLKSPNKELLGAICDRIKSFRPPEPYKGTGIKLSTETIARKAGKAKSAA
jgi:large subunit ribosomal protein L6